MLTSPSLTQLSFIIPVYNEAATLAVVIKRISQLDLGSIHKQIVVVDDGSQDGSLKGIKKNFQHKNTSLITFKHKKNQGKGTAIRTGLKHADGEYIVIQDADLEYHPKDLIPLISCILNHNARVVYGSRRIGLHRNHYSGIHYYWGGIFLTWFTNKLYRSQLTDESTGYKIFKRSLLLDLDLKSKRFEFCPEVTAKILMRNEDIIELPISYVPRGIAEGKKIGIKDFVHALYILLYYRYGYRFA